MDLITLEALDKKGLRMINEMTREMKTTRKEMFFYTPKFLVKI